MDDCSPDDTPRVAAAFTDPRVRYVRNEPNLGHLQNYNKGLSLARGEYLWLISADDRLRRPYVVERFVKRMDARRDAGLGAATFVVGVQETVVRDFPNCVATVGRVTLEPGAFNVIAGDSGETGHARGRA